MLFFIQEAKKKIWSFLNACVKISCVDFFPSRDMLFVTGKWDGSFCFRISCCITKLKEARRSLLQRAGSFWMAALLLVHAWNMRTDRYDWKNVSLLYVIHFLTSSSLFLSSCLPWLLQLYHWGASRIRPSQKQAAASSVTRTGTELPHCVFALPCAQMWVTAINKKTIPTTTPVHTARRKNANASA